MIESCEKSIKFDYSDPISSRRKNAACRRLGARRRSVSLASFVSTFCHVPLRFERKLRAGSVGFFMHSYMVYSPAFFAVASGIKLTRKLFRQATELTVLIDHEFKENSASPPFAFF